MGLAELWTKWFGPAAEINYGAPLADTPRIDDATMGHSKRTTPPEFKMIFAIPIHARRKSRKRGKAKNAHGTASRKSKRRSTKKKPASRKRSH